MEIYICYLLNKNWKGQKELHPDITNDYIDKLFEVALKNGAIGGKLLGAGGGGFMLFYVPQNKQEKVQVALKNILSVPFFPTF